MVSSGNAIPPPPPPPPNPPPPSSTIPNQTAGDANTDPLYANSFTPHADGSDFNLFGEANSLNEFHPPDGLDSIQTDFFGDPENLTLLTEHLREEPAPWDTFKALLDAGQSATPDVDGPRSDFNSVPPPYPKPDSPDFAHAFPERIPSLFSPLRPGGDSRTAPNAGRAPPSTHHLAWKGMPPRDTWKTLGAASNKLEVAGIEGALPTPPESLTGATATRAPSPSLDGASAALDTPNGAAQVDVSIEFDDCPEASHTLYAPLFDAANKLGPEFRACVGSLLKLERAAGWTLKDLRLPGASRPAEFKDWM